MAFDEKPLKQFYLVCSGLAFLYGIALSLVWSFEILAPDFHGVAFRLTRVILLGLLGVLFVNICFRRASNYSQEQVPFSFVLSDIVEDWSVWAIGFMPCGLGFMLSAFLTFGNVPNHGKALALCWVGPIALVMTFLSIPILNFLCWGCSKLEVLNSFRK